MTRPAHSALLAVMMVLWGCTADDPTEVVVAVHSDLQVPAELDSISLTVQQQGSKVVEASFSLSGAGAVTLPATAGILAGKDPAVKILITVAGHKGGAQVVSRRARLSFVAQRILLLRMDLLRSCAGKTCKAPDQTCGKSGCQSIDVDPATLPEYSKEQAFADAGAPDGGPDPQKCGNGKLDPGEPCEGTMLGQKSCTSQKFTGGSLACKPGCTLDTSGCYRLLDPQGLKICGAAGKQAAPTAAFDGKQFLVVWQDYRHASSSYSDIYGARVGTDGKVLPPGEIAISRAPSEQSTPAVSFDGKHFLVVWQDYRDANKTLDIYGARVDSGGKVLDPSGVLISSGADSRNWPAVASGAGGSLVVWDDGRDGAGTRAVHGARVSQGGAVLDKAGTRLSDPAAKISYSAAAAYGSSRYLAVWTACQDSTTCLDHADIHGARIATDGKMLGKRITISAATNGQASPSVAFSGANFLVVWSDKRNARAGKTWDIYGARVGLDGTVLDSGGFPIYNLVDHWSPPVVAYNDAGKYMVVWTQNSGSLTDLYGVRLSKEGKVQAPFVDLSVYNSKKELPQITSYGSRFYVVWSDLRNGATNPDIYAARVEP